MNPSHSRFGNGRQFRRGFSLVEILVALLVVAALAAGTIYIVSNVNKAAVDAKKTETANRLTDMAVSFWQAGQSFDTVDAAGAIELMKTSMVIKSQFPGGASINLRIELPYPNPEAYIFTPSVADTSGPHFTADLGKPNVPAFK